MNFLYNKTTEEVKSISEGDITFSNKNFALKEIKLTDEQSNEIKQGRKLKIVKGKLNIEKFEEDKEKEKKQQIKDDIKKAKNIDELKEILNNLI